MGLRIVVDKIVDHYEKSATVVYDLSTTNPLCGARPYVNRMTRALGALQASSYYYFNGFGILLLHKFTGRLFV